MGTSRHKVTMVYTHPASSQQTNSYAYNNYAAKAAGGPASATWTCFQMSKVGPSWLLSGQQWLRFTLTLIVRSLEALPSTKRPARLWVTRRRSPTTSSRMAHKSGPAPSSSSKKVPYYSLRSLAPAPTTPPPANVKARMSPIQTCLLTFISIHLAAVYFWQKLCNDERCMHAYCLLQKKAPSTAKASAQLCYLILFRSLSEPQLAIDFISVM